MQAVACAPACTHLPYEECESSCEYYGSARPTIDFSVCMPEGSFTVQVRTLYNRAEEKNNDAIFTTKLDKFRAGGTRRGALNFSHCNTALHYLYGTVVVLRNTTAIYIFYHTADLLDA